MTLKIAEIFGPTIQGEGALIGVPTVFVRAGGCDYRCRWCDSLHAVESRFRHDWAALSTGAVWDRVTALSGGQPLTVTLSGGNVDPATFAEAIDAPTRIVLCDAQTSGGLLIAAINRLSWWIPHWIGEPVRTPSAPDLSLDPV